MDVLRINKILPRLNKTDNSNNTVVQNNIDVTEEIRKYKKLLNEGIITQGEFDAMKKTIPSHLGIFLLNCSLYLLSV